MSTYSLLPGKESEQGSPRDQVSEIQKSDVLAWFQQAEEDDAAWVLKRLAEKLPHLVYGARTKQEAHEAGSKVHVQKHQRQDPEVVTTGAPVIQFSSPKYYVEEGHEDIMVLDVMRIGDLSQASEVCYETKDDSALSGRSYVATSGKLVFEPGVSLLRIEIPIINNNLWDTTLEFSCLLKTEGLNGAVLGQYLYRTRVCIIDNNHFPTDQFGDLNTEKKLAECPKWELLFAFFSLVSNIPGVWKASVQYILADLLGIIGTLLSYFLGAYILDSILDTTKPISSLILPDRRCFLLICSLISVAAVGFSHALYYIRLSLPIRGPATNFIQNGLLRKYLNYTRLVREHLQPAAVLMGMQRDAVHLIDHAYFSLLKMIEAFGELLSMFAFQVLTPLLFGGEHDWRALAMLFLTPIVLRVIVLLREAKTEKTLHESTKAQDDFIEQVEEIMLNYHLVIDYSLRHYCEYKLLDKQKLYRTCAKNHSQVLHNNIFLCKWCTTSICAMYLLFGGLDVINGSLPLGFFVMNLKMFERFDLVLKNIYALSIEMMQTFANLVNVTRLMNYPTDVRQRRSLKRSQREHAESKRLEIMNSGIHHFAIDSIPIVLNFEKSFKFAGKLDSLNFRGRVEIHQGQMVAVAGFLGCGKATLLRLLAESVLPEEGRDSPCFVPSHLRVANVADDPFFFRGTLYSNLTFGMDTSQSSASRERVKAICYQLTQSATITDHLDHEDEMPWPELFSGSQSKLLCIARALIHNPALLTIHKPLSRLTERDGLHVIQALHEHIKCKGLALDDDSRRRRLRTVIASAGGDKIAEASHNVLEIDKEQGIKLRFLE